MLPLLEAFFVAHMVENIALLDTLPFFIYYILNIYIESFTYKKV